MRGLLRAQLGPRPRLRPRLRPPTRRRPAALVLVLAALLASAGVPPCAAYLSSGGEASGGEKTSTHAAIVLEALAYLGKVMPVDSELRPHLEQLAGHRSLLVRGSNDAEREGGRLSLLGAEMGRSGLAHFYNPTTGQGYRGAERVRWVQTLESMGWLDGALTQALGPALSSEGLSEWYYARAVQSQLVRGGAEEAARALGYAAHLVADATVPQHATDCGEENGDACHHDRYERFVEQNYGRYGQPRSTYWELETVARGIDTPGLLVVRASHLSAPLIEPASSGQAELMDMVAARTVALAKELTAALILRYLFDVAERKQVEAVVLQITRARMQGALRGDGGTPADLVPVVRTVRGGGGALRGARVPRLPGQYRGRPAPAGRRRLRLVLRPLRRGGGLRPRRGHLQPRDVGRRCRLPLPGWVRKSQQARIHRRQHRGGRQSHPQPDRGERGGSRCWPRDRLRRHRHQPGRMRRHCQDRLRHRALVSY